LLSAALLAPREAAAQTTTTQDPTWGLVSNITMLIDVGVVTLMPRIYYNDPEATVGWKARWHISVLAPALSMTALTLLVDGPIKNAIGSPRPNCTAEDTGLNSTIMTGCNSFGMPSTQSFAAWGAMGTGTAIFLVDTLKYSNSKFHAGSFVGNVAVPFVLSVVTSVARTQASGGNSPAETPIQVVAGSLSGFVTGALVGVGYSFMQRPNCGYGNSIVCW
jgi:hypothetical protein